MHPKTPFVLILSLVIVIASPACTPVSAEPALPIAPISLGEDLTAIDVCEAIPQENIETVMGVKLVEAPTRYSYSGADGTSGCYYEGPTDSDRERHFGYVILTPPEMYDNQTLFQNEEVSGIGDGAYFNRGSDARQLWVKIDDKVAFVIAFGDVAKEEGAKAIARLMVEAIK
ncbi:MAG TPA: hypothetical protein VI524_04880 [Anaerolineales bacterium]|nr:hypothetical protein [Anaerolineales bacterium]